VREQKITNQGQGRDCVKLLKSSRQKKTQGFGEEQGELWQLSHSFGGSYCDGNRDGPTHGPTA
jgi:hypothetical protein